MKTNNNIEIYENYLNGNISDFKNQIKKMSKQKLFNFILDIKLSITEIDFLNFIEIISTYNYAIK